MRRTTMTLAAAALTFGLAACETEGGADGADTAMMTGGADTMSAMQQEGMGERMEIQFQAVNNSGVGGEVYLTPTGERTTVVVTLQPPAGADPSGHTHMAHIHTGTCANIGTVVASLDTIVNDTSRGPTSTTVVDISLAALTDGNHLVAAHEAGGTPGSPVVCAEIPAGMGGSDTAATAM